MSESRDTKRERLATLARDLGKAHAVRWLEIAEEIQEASVYGSDECVGALYDLIAEFPVGRKPQDESPGPG
jgi:hypothetical protein